jgi:hypothetical protein
MASTATLSDPIPVSITTEGPLLSLMAASASRPDMPGRR